MPPRSRLLVLVLATALLPASGCGGAQARKASHMEKGRAFLAAENVDKARIEFLNALQIDPKDPEARFRMGVVEEKLGRLRQAAASYQGAIDVSPDHDYVAARVALGRLYLFSGAPDRALELIKQALEKHPGDPEALTLRAAAREQQGETSAALIDAERAVALAPANENAVATLAGIYSSGGQSEKTQALLEHSIEKIPGTVDLRLSLAQFYAQNHREAEAEALFLKLVELKPGDKAHRERLVQFYLTANQVDAAERSLRQAVKDLPGEDSLKIALVNFLAARRGRDQAEAELKGMIAAAPAKQELKFALARFYEEGSDFKQSEAVLNGIIEQDKLGPAGLMARDQLAVLRLRKNDSAGALSLANEVLASSPRDEYALLLRGNIALVNQDPRAAIADLRAVLRDDPTAVGVLRTLARAHLANGEPDSAEETLRRAVEANPRDQQLKLELARLLAQLGKPEPAQAILIDLVQQDPSNIDALDAEFRVSSTMHNYLTAKSAADAIVALQPTRAMGYLYQGVLAETGDHPEEALRLYRTALSVQPGAPEPLEAEVHLLIHQKRVPEALKLLDEAAARQPQDAVALNLKGELLTRNGRNAEAIDVFKQAIARAPKWWFTYRNLAQAQLASKDPDAAAATLRNGMSAAGEPQHLVFELTSVLIGQGKNDEAIAAAAELVRSDPRSELAANNLAILLVTFKTDRASLDRARELVTRFRDSSNPSYLDTYGWVLFKRGEVAAALPILARVVEKAPNVVLAHYHLGMAQSQIGENSAARQNLTAAVDAGFKFAGLDEAKATLERIANLPDAHRTAPQT